MGLFSYFLQNFMSFPVLLRNFLQISDFLNKLVIYSTNSCFSDIIYAFYLWGSLHVCMGGTRPRTTTIGPWGKPPNLPDLCWLLQTNIDLYNTNKCVFSDAIMRISNQLMQNSIETSSNGNIGTRNVPDLRKFQIRKRKTCPEIARMFPCLRFFHSSD